MPAATDTLLPPRYRDVRPLARGGMGEIFRATDSELGREVAIKLLAERFSADPESRARFHREALAAARLSGTPSIITIFDVGEHNGRPLIVMEYVPGGSLADWIDAAKPRSTAQVLDWLEETSTALDAAHAAGVVHRDVKPANLLLDGRGHVLVADFGIASAAGLDALTQAGTVLGTAGYLSPEQARGERATAASDLYGLAVVAWELFTGRRPFEAASATAEAAAHVNAPVPSVHSANPALPAGFDAIFERALAKDPRRRHATAAELVGELRRALHDDAGETWVERPAGSVTTATAAPPQRRAWLLAGLLAAGLLAAGILTAVLVGRGGDGTTRARTVVRTVTGPGATVRATVRETVTAPVAPPTTAADAGDVRNGAALNNSGYSRMRAGDYGAALPLLEQAVRELRGTGSVDEAYADYNLAYTTLALGQCTNVVGLLDRSESIQGHRPEIDRLRHEARKSCR